MLTAVTSAIAFVRATPVLLGLAAFMLTTIGFRVFSGPATMTVHEVEARAQKQRADKLEKALTEAHHTINQREEHAAQLAAYIAEFEHHAEDARKSTADADVIVLPADDRWLQQWQKRGR